MRMIRTRHFLLGLFLLWVAAGCTQLGGSTAVVPEPPWTDFSESGVPPATVNRADLRYATAKRAEFETLSLSDGLSQSVVLDMLQDGRGFLWLATQDGLNRYDGYSFRVYKHAASAETTLSQNFVTALAQDAQGNLWVGTNGRGVDRFDPATGRFSHFESVGSGLSDDFVNALLVDGQDILWVGTSAGGLCRLDEPGGQFSCLRQDSADAHGLGSDNIQDIVEGPDGRLWVATIGGGLVALDPQTGQLASYRYDSGAQTTLSSDNIQALALDPSGQIWVGTTDAGLNRFDPATGTAVRYPHDPDNAQSPAHDNITALQVDDHGTLWVGTNGGGLSALDVEQGRWIHYRTDPTNPSAVANDQVWSIFQDEAGVLWFGTFGGGVSKYDPARQKFALYRAAAEAEHSLSSNQVWSFGEDRAGSLWIGTNSGGLSHYDPVSGAWETYQNDPDDPSSLAGDWVMAVHEDPDGNLWAGSFGAPLSRLDRESDGFIRYPDAGSTAVIAEDSRGQLWIGGYGLGLGKYDRAADQFVLYTNDPDDPQSLSHNDVIAIAAAPDGTLWLATFGGGLNHFDPQTETAVRYQHDPDDPNSLVSNLIVSMYLAADGSVWVGTDSGLDRFEPASGAWTHFNEENGLINTLIYAILEDDHGRLWFTHNKGLTRYDPRAGAFAHFSERDGLQSNEFNQGAALKSETGEMLFGGIRGFNAFHPDGVVDSRYSPPIVITEFQLFNDVMVPGEDSPLAQTIETADAINLTYRDDFFSFAFASLHFSTPSLNQYAYILEGFDTAWNMVGMRHFASYTNVPPGNYTFRVMGTNSDGVWTGEERALSILIPPPFWETTWFRVLAVVGFAAVIAGAFYWRVRAIEAQRRQLALLVDERTRELRETLVELERARDAAEAANRAKSIFLANMSHEFRTPLNAIMGFTQLSLRDPTLEVGQTENLEVIHRSSEHLLGLINDVLELSKIEAGRAMLNPQAFDLHRMLFGMEEMFALRARDKGIDLELVLDDGVPRYILADAGRLRQILLNLLGNAVKFTTHGRVYIHAAAAAGLEAEQVMLLIDVTDTGPGIAPEEQEALFEPFVQAAAGQIAQEGTGLGLTISRQNARLMGGDIAIDSDLGRGSTFQLSVPCELVPETAVRQPQQRRRVVGLQPGQAAYRLLVVDDQPTNRQILVKLLTPLGFEVREASNGQEAIDIWQAWAPHLIWMDMRMPVMNGYEATRRIKATTKGQATVIVALTASGMEEERAVILSEGCDDYIRKPFYEEELYAALVEHLGVRFVYAVEDEDGGDAPAVVYPDAGLVARTAALPGELALRLRQVAMLGDVTEIHDTIAAINRQDAVLGATLAKWARDFDHGRILRLLEAANVAGTVHETSAT